MGYGDIVKFETLFDDEEVTVGGKSLIKDEVLKRIKSTGQNLEIIDREEGFIVKVVDPDESQGYNKFKTVGEYQEWLNSSLYEPTQDEIQEASNGSRA
jgi:hypothetical protein